MGFEVRWSDEAQITFDAIIDSINERWGQLPAEKFRKKTMRLLTTISHQPLLFPESGIENVRKAVITKQSSIFYEVYNNRILLLYFWDNRQDPQFF